MTLAKTLKSLQACDESIAYVSGHADPVAALAECPDRCWLTWLAAALMRRGYLKCEVIALCACASARTALHHVPVGEMRPLRAIETTEAWARGEATTEEVRVARVAAAAYADAADYASAYAYAAYAAAYTYAYADAAYAYAAYAAAYAARSAARSAARAKANVEQLALTKWMLGPALLDGLRRYEMDRVGQQSAEVTA